MLHGANIIKIICCTCTCCDPGDMLQVLKLRGLVRQNKQFQALSTLLHGASIYNKPSIRLGWDMPKTAFTMMIHKPLAC